MGMRGSKVALLVADAAHASRGPRERTIWHFGAVVLWHLEGRIQLVCPSTGMPHQLCI